MIECQLTERDLALFSVVGRYRYMTTSQIHRLVFAPSCSMQATRRRLLKLFSCGYLGKANTRNWGEEDAYYLDTDGKNAILEDLPLYPRTKPGRGGKQFLAHTLAVSEFRLNLELAVALHPWAILFEYTGEHELRRDHTKVRGIKAFKLYQDTRIRPLLPDGRFQLGNEQQQRTFYLEVDLGTERLKTLAEKVEAYQTLRDHLVLFVFQEQQRLNYFIKLVSPSFVRATLADSISPHSLLTEQIWLSPSGEAKSILRPNMLSTSRAQISPMQQEISSLTA